MTQAIQVITTVETRDEADGIAQALVERRLAACVQVLGPVTSTFHWQGRVDVSQEWLCIAKTLERHFAEIERTIRELHSYDVPEILAVPVSQASGPYLQWLEKEVEADS